MATTEQTAQAFLDLAHRFFRMRPRLMFPDERIATMKHHLHRLRLHRLRHLGGSGSPEDRLFVFRILDLLMDARTPPTMGEVGTQLGIPLSSATRMADTLVHAGLAKRLIDRNDRRVVRLTITDNGREFMGLGMDYLKQRIGGLLGHFTPDEQAQLLHLMSKLIDSVEAERSKEPRDATL
jgi:DNA-binding MarR family transcriptional regulator